jgi:hypothetical protein
MDKLTPKMIQALIDLRLENVKDPKSLNPAVRTGLVKRSLLSRHSQPFADGTSITYHSFTAKGEDLADQLIQDRELGHLTEEIWDAALVEDLKRSGDEDVSDHEPIGGWVTPEMLDQAHQEDNWRSELAHTMISVDPGSPEMRYLCELQDAYRETGTMGEILPKEMPKPIPFWCPSAPVEPIPAEHPWNASFVEADEAEFEEARGDFGGTDPEAEEMYEQGRRFARHGAGSDEDHPEFLRGYQDQQILDEPVVLLTSAQVITNASRIAHSRTTSMELHVVRQAQGDESRYLLIISKLSRYLPRRIIEILVERLVIPRCPVCSVKPGRQEFAVKHLDRGIRWAFTSYCSDTCRSESGSRMGWIRKPAA